MTDDRPLVTHETDYGIDIFKQSDGNYEIHTHEKETFVGGKLNIAGRTAALAPDTELNIGAGEPGIIIRVYEDRRGEGNELLAVSFTTEAGL
jgi:hypothetical protein